MISINGLLNKYKTLPLVAKSTLWFTICNFLVSSLGFITAPLFTRLLSEAEYGKLSIYYAYEQLLLIVLTWEMHLGGYQKGLFKYKGQEIQFTKNTLLLTNLITLIGGGLLLLFVKQFREFTGFGKIPVICLMIEALLIPGYYCWLIRKRTSYEYKKAVPITLLYSLSNIVFSVFALVLLSATADVKFCATCLVAVSFGAVFYFNSLFKNDPCSIESDRRIQWKFLLVFQAPLVIHSLSYYALNQIDRIMIGKFVGNEETAYYSIAYALAMAISILQSSLNNTLTPWRFSKLQQNSYNEVRESATFLLVLMASAIILFILIVPDVMRLLFPVNYYSAVWCIPPVSAGIFFIFLYSFFVNIESYYEKTVYIMVVSLSCSVLNIVLNYLLIPRYGYISSAYTTLVSYICFAFLHYLSVRVITRKIVRINEIVDIKKIIIISCSFLLLVFVSTLSYQNHVIRYSLLIVLSLIIYKYRLIIKQHLLNLNFKKNII
ncbi:MAG: oligosaccharide flippase family protein [Bacteroides sp.]|nr:oligosaccharide flippase family protein [Bacteroides sp.]